MSKYEPPLIGAREYHGMSKTAMYARWKQIKQRTTNSKAKNYQNYGGRGITMCVDWISSFKSFYAFMGDPPTPKHTIERIDNNKGYEPGNVRWATYSEQLINQRDRKSLYNLPGVRKTRNTFWAMIGVRGKRIYLGSFSTPQAAHEAYCRAKKEHYNVSA